MTTTRPNRGFATWGTTAGRRLSAVVLLTAAVGVADARGAPPPNVPTQPPQEQPSAAPAPAEDVFLVTTAVGVKVRRNPKRRGRLVGVLGNGEEVQQLELGRVARVGRLNAPWIHVKARDGLEGWTFGAYLEPSPRSPAVDKATVAALRSRTPSVFSPLDSETLEKLLRRRGYIPPSTFKALVIVITGDEDKGFEYHPFDFRHTSSDSRNWWPASTVKLYAAVAALERVRDRGMDERAKATFHYLGEDGQPAPETNSLRWLVRQALTPSNNAAFDKLVEIAGSQYLNGHFFTKRNGFRHTMLLRSYKGRYRSDTTEESTNRYSPRIELRQGSRVKVFEERRNTRSYGNRTCPGIEKGTNRPRPHPPWEGNCTSLWDLSETLRRVMMHEHLPRQERFDLGSDELDLLRRALSGKRSRGNNVPDALRAAFGTRAIETFSKPGYAQRWYSDHVFVHVPSTGERYLVAAANYPGRTALDEAAKHIGAILASGELLRLVRSRQSKTKP